jgi:glycosyltransferase involved in cell wall biosynthesis
MRILYVCDADGGGIAEYAIRQSRALSEAGAEVTFLCRPTFRSDRLIVKKVIPALPAARSRGAFPFSRLARQIADVRRVARNVANQASETPYDALLFACYAEYFSPFWAGTYRRIARQLPIGTIAHDPVRDFVLGPGWWHRLSIRRAYSFVKQVFVHDDTPVDFGGKAPGAISTHVIPHGPFEISPPRQPRVELRTSMGFDAADQVFLSFGQIRDGKNLDRFLRVMPRLPESVKLLVAGSGGGGSQRPPESYRQLAEELGVGQRCRWDIRYIPDEETGDLFAAADFVLMTYSAKFRSASGVLNAAVHCRKPLLVSSGPGPLKSATSLYQLGVFVDPDDDLEIEKGATRLLAEPPRPEWERYERENSWEENARLILQAFALETQK